MPSCVAVLQLNRRRTGNSLVQRSALLVVDQSLPICFRLSLSVVHYSGSIEALVVLPFRGTLDDGRTGSHVVFETLLSNTA